MTEKLKTLNNHILAVQDPLSDAWPPYYKTLCGLRLHNDSLRKLRNGKLCPNCKKIMRKQRRAKAT